MSSGKETDRKWEEGEDPSVLEFTSPEYGRNGKVLASEEVKLQIKEIDINSRAHLYLMRGSQYSIGPTAWLPCYIRNPGPIVRRRTTSVGSRYGLTTDEMGVKYGRFLAAVKGTGLEGERAQVVFAGMAAASRAAVSGMEGIEPCCNRPRCYSASPVRMQPIFSSARLRKFPAPCKSPRRAWVSWAMRACASSKRE